MVNEVKERKNNKIDYLEFIILLVIVISGLAISLTNMIKFFLEEDIDQDIFNTSMSDFEVFIITIVIMTMIFLLTQIMVIQGKLALNVIQLNPKLEFTNLQKIADGTMKVVVQILVIIRKLKKLIQVQKRV